MDTTKLLIAAVVGLCLILWQGINRTTIAAILVSLLFSSFTITLIKGASQSHIGIAHSGVELTAASLLIIVALLAYSLVFRRFPVPWMALPFVVYSLFAVMFIWGGTTAQWSGVFLVIVAIAAFALGIVGGKSISFESRTAGFLLFLVAAVVAIEVIVVLLQFAGVSIFPMDGRIAKLMGTRTNGTFEHPANLGKALVFLSVLVLPFLRSASRVRTGVASVTLAATLIPLVLSGGRANLIAYVGMLAVWFWFNRPRLSGRIRIFAIVAAVIAGAAVTTSVIVRMLEQGSLGERDHFIEVALAQIGRTPWFGVGLNNYLDAVGPYDKLTSQGWPVHNIFLHMAVETGIIGAILFFGPLIWSFIIAFRMRRVGGNQETMARAYLALLPVVLSIGFTGWALLSNSELYLWFLISGFFIGQLSRDRWERKVSKRFDGLLNGVNIPQLRLGLGRDAK
ncbi:O-antigen ligase family protein [Mycetocola tolaasinivorans]|uniref:O-antigen ligase family protein n=1 Tax=Mycetocola tolaasinivorans TaxID=76635 RepID=A0A3L7ADH2_9MICO|nr:O-antigen ligase family protein [Mycetocola tolaasinivorans]RLP77432.1 O-antigen ligase family protein [Mycetocola tolaasinivorans]